MPKKKRKARKANSKPAATRTSTPAPWPVDGVLVEDDYEEDYEDEDIREDLLKQYPTVHDAVTAMKGGEKVEWWGSIDGGPMRHQVLDTDEGPVVEQAIFLDCVLEGAVRCARLQSDDLFRTDAGILTAMDELHEIVRPVLAAKIRENRPDYQPRKLDAFTETIEGLQRFGWRTRYPASTVSDWEETWDTVAWNMSVAFYTAYGLFEDRVPETKLPAIHARLQQHGVPLVVCEGCGCPLTNRHHRWPGVWVAPMPEVAALCDQPGGEYLHLRQDDDDEARFSDDDFGFPHQPQPPTLPFTD